MSTRSVLLLIGASLCLAPLGGCASSSKLSDLWPSKGAEESATTPADTNDTTGSIVTQPAEPGPSGEPTAPLAKPGLLGDDPSDDLQFGKKYFRSNNFGLAEKSFR